MKSKTEISPSHPFFSVIIATYNRQDLISRALNSLVNQTDDDWAGIIVDDGSTDDTHLRIMPFLRKYPQLRYLKHPHEGEASSKNAGIRAATGKFITFLDSDDEYNLFHLETRKSLLQQNPSIKFLYGGVKILGNQFVPDRFDPTRKINLKETIIGGTFFIEKEIILSLNGFTNILLGPDSEFFDRAKDAHIEMMEVTIPTYIYHHETKDSITNELLQDLT